MCVDLAFLVGKAALSDAPSLSMLPLTGTRRDSNLPLKDQNVSSPSLFHPLPLAHRFRNPTQHRTHSVNHHGRDYDADLREPGDRCKLIFWISFGGRIWTGRSRERPFPTPEVLSIPGQQYGMPPGPDELMSNRLPL